MAAALNPGRCGRACTLSCRRVPSGWWVSCIISRTPDTKPLFSFSEKNISLSVSQSSSAFSYFLTVVSLEISTALISIFIPSLARLRLLQSSVTCLSTHYISSHHAFIYMDCFGAGHCCACCPAIHCISRRRGCITDIFRAIVIHDSGRTGNCPSL
jgi:hypothetical protein